MAVLAFRIRLLLLLVSLCKEIFKILLGLWAYPPLSRYAYISIRGKYPNIMYIIVGAQKIILPERQLYD